MELAANETARKVIEDKADQVKEVATENGGVLVDIDTPDEYRLALARAKV
jgi:CTP:molybdopterin cytidylyltransferase MocA